MLRKRIYKWHRTLSLIIALPVVLWAISGFMHPIMTTFRPKVGSQFIPAMPIDSSQLKVSLQKALAQNSIAQFSNVRIVKMGGNWFYQISLPASNTLTYISTRSGKILPKGDALYAQHLARKFLVGIPQKQVVQQDAKTANGPSAMSISLMSKGDMGSLKNTGFQDLKDEWDCCMLATYAVQNDTTGAPVKDVHLLTSFDKEYGNINRLLPVYKVSFDRQDGIRIYVETGSDKFAYAVDNKRAFFDAIFRNLHTLSFLQGSGNTGVYITLLIMLIAFTTACMGLYIFFTTSGKKASKHALVKARYNHRWTSVVASAFTLMFTFSGGYHALGKLQPDTRHLYEDTPLFETAKINLDLPKLYNALDSTVLVTNLRLVKLQHNNYWQVFNKPKNEAWNNQKQDGNANTKPRSDLMKDKMVPAPTMLYVHAGNYELLDNGEQLYASHLAQQFSGNSRAAVTHLEVITKFEGEYGFVNKRLPVWKASFADIANDRWYVETSSGKLAAHVTDADLPEGYSFAILHKHHFMDWAGKTGRDLSTMFWAAMQVAMVVVGLVLWRRSVKRG